MSALLNFHHFHGNQVEMSGSKECCFVIAQDHLFTTLGPTYSYICLLNLLLTKCHTGENVAVLMTKQASLISAHMSALNNC